MAAPIVVCIIYCQRGKRSNKLYWQNIVVRLWFICVVTLIGSVICLYVCYVSGGARLSLKEKIKNFHFTYTIQLYYALNWFGNAKLTIIAWHAIISQAGHRWKRQFDAFALTFTSRPARLIYINLVQNQTTLNLSKLTSHRQVRKIKYWIGRNW